MENKKVKIKICCMQNIDEVKLAMKYGASAVGLVSAMPSGAGIISDEKILEISRTIPEEMDSFLLTSLTEANEIITQYKKFRTTTIQLVDDVTSGIYKILKDELPEVKIVQVIHVGGEESIQKAISIQNEIDMILLDSGNQKLKVKELGGTGRVHDWSISRKIVEAVNIPVFLAGGLNPDNIKEAIETVKPYGVDVCSGLRENEMLVEERLKSFVNNINI
jgi:phosphoribosylanthranilate isomerase